MPALPALARELITVALRAADPAAALRVGWIQTQEPEGRRVILSAGKASIAMVRQAVRLVRNRYEAALVTAPPELAAVRLPRAEVWPCDHPYPTARNARAARAIRKVLTTLGPQDELLVLLSGGASAHLSLPAPGVTVRDLSRVTRLLQKHGATIEELNTVRKHIEQLKGGRLVAMAACPVRAYILSDVIGDRLDVIGSGPTAPDPTTSADAFKVLRRRGLLTSVPRIADFLRRCRREPGTDTPKPGDPCLKHVKNTIIAGNALVTHAIARHLRRKGWNVEMRTGITGEARLAANEFCRGAMSAHRADACVIGGETTVTVGKARGLGGPSQEFALAAAILLQRRPYALLTFSTDGRDGPTDAAGAFITGKTADAMRHAGINPSNALSAHDSHRALDRVGALIRVPPTGTNLNHVAVLIRLRESTRES